MRKFLLIFLVVCFIGCKQSTASLPIEKVIDNALNVAVEQYKLMYSVIDTLPDQFPKTIDPKGNLETCDSYFWTSGFFPGTLWYMYEYTNDSALKMMASDITNRVEIQKYNKDNHDVGFMINCSFGNKYRLLHDTTSKEVIVTAANSLSTRFRKTVGCTRSWDHPESLHWQFPVIIDNMMNLELLIKASELCGDNRLYEMAVSHANVTMKNHFRSDYSSYHVVNYDTITGNSINKCTWQGYSDESVWSRGQAWGLYGYTMMYRETEDVIYLEQAKNIAKFILSHPNMPTDKIPYWDLSDPAIPNSYRDASAAAIMASALIELSTYVEKPLSINYLAVAEQQIRTLASDTYLSKVGENHNFILKHSVGFLPKGSEVDVPLSYADYYFIEALMRYKNLKNNGKI